MKRFVLSLVIGGMLVAAVSAFAFDPDGLVSVGSPPRPFSQNKQNEPALAVDANHPNVLVAGANDEIDMEACNAGADNTCPFTPGVGVSGVYFSFDSGDDLDAADVHRPDRARLPGRGRCRRSRLHAARRRRSARCRGTPRTGWSPTATRPSRSDPRPGPAASAGRNGSRLYYANLTVEPRRHALGAGVQGLRGDRRLAHRRPARRRGGDKNAWCMGALDARRCVISRQSSTTFSDKEQIWADNAVLEPVLRHRLRVLGGVPRPGEGQRGAGARCRWRSPTTAATPGGSTRSRRPRTTASATRPTAAPSAPTAAATPTCSASAPSRLRAASSRSS